MDGLGSDSLLRGERAAATYNQPKVKVRDVNSGENVPTNGNQSQIKESQQNKEAQNRESLGKKKKTEKEPSEEEIDIFGGKQNDCGTYIP